MPFLTDMLEQTQRKRALDGVLSVENRAPDGLVQAHLCASSSLESRYRFDIGVIMASLRSEILGQDAALQSVEDMLKVVRADITDPRRPLFTALFLGPTGVGKTEIVRALARALHGDADAFCRVDMNTLSQEHYAAALSGAPPGYVGAKEGTTLLDQEKLEGSVGRPGIMLFDELEKASPQVVQTLLNVLDNGMLTVASGERTYSFRNTLIFMTSNLAAHEIQRYDQRRTGWRGLIRGATAASRQRAVDGLVRARLLKAFAPEFINRIDKVITFNWIEQGIAEQLAALEVKRLNRRLQKHGCAVEVTPPVLARVIAKGFDRQFGARALRRSMRQHLEVPLAGYLIDHHARTTATANIVYLAVLEHGEVHFLRR